MNNIRNAKQTATAAIIIGTLSFALFKTQDLMSRLIILPFLLFAISLFIQNVCMMFNKIRLAELFSKIKVLSFLIYMFGFITVWCFVSLKNGDYLQALFTLPFWIVGIFLIKKKLFNNKAKSKNSSGLSIPVVVSSLLVGTVFFSGIAMLYFGIKDTYELNIKTKYYITTEGYFNHYDVYDVDKDGITYQLTYIYTVDNQEYSLTTDYGTNYIPEPNSTREIKYNPNNPNEAILTGTNSKNGLIYFGAFFTFGSLTFIIAALTIFGYFDKFKIDVLGTYVGLLFVIIGIGIISFQTGTTTSLIETVKSFGLLMIIPIMMIILGLIQTVKCFLKIKQ